MERMDELMRPPAAVSAMLMVSPRDLSRDVTSSRIGRMALGGKSEAADVVDMLRCTRSAGDLLDEVIVVYTGVLVVEKPMVRVWKRRRRGFTTDVALIEERHKEGIYVLYTESSRMTMSNGEISQITNHCRPALMPADVLLKSRSNIIIELNLGANPASRTLFLR